MPHELNDNSLVDWNAYITFIGESTDDSTISKDQVNIIINMASEVIEKYLDRKIITATDLVEVFDGDGEKDRYVRNKPITGTPTIEHWTGSTWDEITTDESTRVVDTVTGRIYFNDGTKFTKGEDNWRITYSYGVARKDVPPNLQQACLIWTQRTMMKAEGKEGVEAESLIDRSVTINLSNMPADVRLILDQERPPNLG